MKDNTIKVLVGLVILLAITSLLGLKKQNFSVPVASEAAQSPIVDNNYSDLKKLFFERYTSLIVSTDGEKLDPEIQLSDTTLKHHKLSDVKKGKKILVFRYSYKDCDLCIKSTIKLLEEHFQGKDKEKVVLITDSYSDRDFILKARYTESRFALYNTPEGGLNLPAENRNLPFLFILGTDNKVVKIYLPFKELPDQTEEYLTYVKDYLAKLDK